MWILQVLWIVLSVLCSLLLSFCICQVQQFCRTISYGVPSCLLPCILFIVHTSLQGMFVVCHINQIAILVMVSHFWNRYCRFPFRLSNSFPLCSAPRHYSLSYEVCKPCTHVGFPMSELPTSRILLLLLLPYPFVFIFNADSRAEGVEFPTLYASRLSDIFFNASFCRFGRFRFGCFKKVGSG